MSAFPGPLQPKRTHSRARGCLLWFIGVSAAIIVLIIGIGFASSGGSRANTPGPTYDAGPASEYPLANVVPIPDQHLFLTRLQDGSYVALYDKSSRQQELHGDCRVTWDPTAPTGSAKQLPGFTGAFVEDCESEGRTVWLADGTFAFGSGYGNLDRYETHVDASGNLVVDLASRTCTRSRGVIGIPPFDVTHCGVGN